jgi:hypothetical protein
VGPRAGVENVEKRNFFTLPGIELRSLGRPPLSRSLYGIRYPGSNNNLYNMKVYFMSSTRNFLFLIQTGI